MKRSLSIVLQPFSLGQISDTLVIMRVLEREGYGVQSLERYLDYVCEVAMGHRSAIAAEYRAYELELEKSSPKCPDCGKAMFVSPVNSAPGNMIGGTAKSMWQCQDLMACGFSIESEATVLEEMKKLGVSVPAIAKNNPLSPPPSVRRPPGAETEPERAAAKRRVRAAKNRMRTTNQEPPHER